MGRRPCCAKQGLNRGVWSSIEDHILTNYIYTHGEGKWRDLPQKAGLKRCGKSCRLRWLNYLRPDIKRGNISVEEDELIVRLHKLLGNRWALIAGRLPGRTDNEIKNYWNTNLSKRVENDKVVDKYLTNKQSSWEDDQSQVIRTKAFRCTKAVFPSLKGDNKNPTLIPNTARESESPISYNSAQQDHGDDKDTHNSHDFLVDFDINDFLMSDVIISSDKFQESNKENNNNNNNIEKYNEVVVDHHSVENDDQQIEGKLDDDFTINYEETRSDHEKWINSESFPFRENEVGLDLNALSSFLNSEDDQWIC